MVRDIPLYSMCEHHLVPSAPADLVQFSGFLEQATFVIPSLDLVVVRFGFPPGANWKYHLFANLLAGIPGARPAARAETTQVQGNQR